MMKDLDVLITDRPSFLDMTFMIKSHIAPPASWFKEQEASERLLQRHALLSVPPSMLMDAQDPITETRDEKTGKEAQLSQFPKVPRNNILSTSEHLAIPDREPTISKTEKRETTLLNH
jgi:hypothetical protein